MPDAARPLRAAMHARAARLALLATLCAPLLAGCYVVPVAPAEPVYRPVYPKPYYYPRPHYRGYGPYGLGDLPAAATGEAGFARPAGAGDVAPSFEGRAMAFAAAERPAH